VISLALLSLASWIGTVQRRRRRQEHDVRECGVVEKVDADFPRPDHRLTFAMAIVRFDQRRHRRCAGLFLGFRV
jgi:hypothetical protein